MILSNKNTVQKAPSEKRNSVEALLTFDLRRIRVCFSLNRHISKVNVLVPWTASVAVRVSTMFNNVLVVTTCREHWTDFRERCQTKRLAGIWRPLVLSWGLARDTTVSRGGKTAKNENRFFSPSQSYGHPSRLNMPKRNTSITYLNIQIESMELPLQLEKQKNISNR